MEDLDKVTFYHEQGRHVEISDAPWDIVAKECPDEEDKKSYQKFYLTFLKYLAITKKPEKMKSLKPFVLLFDEFYTNIYRMDEAENWMQNARKIVFLELPLV